MRLELPADIKLVHEMRIPVRWGDLDAMGHVNNTIYLRYFETLRIDWLRQFAAEPNSRGVGPVMANAFCNFIRQIEFPGEIVARHFVSAPGSKSVDTFFTLSMSEAPDVVCANGGATLVWLDFPNKTTVALPEDVRVACA